MRMGGMIEELDSGVCTSRQARHTVRENTLSGQTLRRSETPVPTPFSSTDSAAMMSFTHLSDRDRSQPLVCRRWGIAIYQDNMSRSRQAFPEGVIVRRTREYIGQGVEVAAAFTIAMLGLGASIEASR